MKPLIISACLGVLALMATGCASKQVTHQRGWIGGDYLVAKRTPCTTSDRHGVVPAFPRQLEGSQRAAIFVSGVYSNTPLASAGIRPGDLILAVDQQPVEKLAAFHRIIDQATPGSAVSVAVFRDGQREDHTVRIGRETYKNWRTVAIGVTLSSKLELDLVPRPEFSWIALGYSRDPQRAELHSPRNLFVRQTTAGDPAASGDGAGSVTSEAWRTWLAIFSLGGYKAVLSQSAE